MSTITAPQAMPNLSVGYADVSRTPTSSPAQLQEAAEQFESMFIDMWLKSARKANQAFGENNLFNSNQVQMQQEMLDHEMAVHMAKNGGVGLAPTIVRQLGGSAESAAVAKPSADIPSVSTPASAQVGMDNPSHLRSPESMTVAHFGQRLSAFSSPEEFVERLAPVLKQVLEAADLPPLAVLSQAALETGWGRQVIADADGQLSHNLFGIKTNAQDDIGDSVAIASKEFEFGRWQDKVSEFRSYPDWQSAVEDYVALLKNSPRYQQIMASAGDAVEFVRGLQQAGYATDPNYADKIVGVMRAIERMEF